MTQQTLNVIVNGNQYMVEVQDVNASPLTMVINGNTYTVELSGSAPVVTPQAAPQPAAAPAKPAESPKAATQATATPAAAGSGSTQVVAPMPGVILDITVKAGDSVKKGDPLCALEAMKMKSAIRAPQDGTISSVEVREGQKVNHNDVLVRFA